MIVVNPNINKKLGYYLCDNLEFDSKIQACLHSVKTLKPIQWVFNNDVFKTYDWTVEPEETLDQLYDQRARQIREQYDYIILSYSGGSDSNNILTAFERQGLHIDEIVVNTMSKASSRAMTVDINNTDAYNAPEAEHELHTLNRLNYIRSVMPNTKITVVDLSDYLFESLEKAGDASWVLTKREGVNPAGMTRFNYLHFTDVRKQFDKDKKIGIIVGIEKPRTMIHRGSFFMLFADRSTNMITIAEHLKDYPNSTIEFFYWSPDCVPLLIKQGHVIKRWLEAFPENQPLWVREESLKGKVYRQIHDPLLRQLLYTTWNEKWFQSKKAVGDWSSEFDQWFEDLYKDTNAYKVWEEGIKYLEDNLTPFLKQTTDGKNDGLKAVYHTYSLGPMKKLHQNLLWID